MVGGCGGGGIYSLLSETKKREKMNIDKREN